ncbi:MAG TPA: AAA family ATPase [Candidatus Limnocylindrales bacterium]
MTELVGRGAELARVSAWLRGDGPPLLLLEGPPGLGKTTLWQAIVAEEAGRGTRILSSAPVEAESGLSYSGLADLLASDLADVRAMLPPPQARALAVALRLEDPSESAADETAVARGALEALRTLSARGGRILIAIDDLRWLDAPSLAVVAYVARRLQPADGVRILATHRLGAPEPAGLERAAIERLTLGPLSVGGIHRVLRLHTGASLPRPRLLEIHSLSLGNPLHAIELMRSIETHGSADRGTLASLFGGRIDALEDGARGALVLLAASADRSIDRLAAAWDASPLATAGEAWPHAVRSLEGAGLASVVGGVLRPVHPLATHIAYEVAAPSARRAVHRALAGTAVVDEERALHLGRSTDGPDGDVADVMEATAHAVRVRGVRAVSAALFERAAVITPPEQAEAQGRRWLAAAAAWFDAGDTHRVERILQPLVDAWPPGAQRAEARWHLGIALDEAGRWQEAVGLWRGALDDTDDPTLRASVQCSLAITGMYTESVAVAQGWAAAAVESAERSADPAALARSLAVHAFILALAGQPGGQALMDRALVLEGTIDEHLGEWSPAALAAECARHAGDIPASIGHYATVLDRATTRGDANVEQWAAFGLASAVILAGDVERASALADLVLDIADQTDVMRIPARSLRARVDAHRGELVAARAILAESMAMARAGDETTHLFGGYIVLATIETCAGDAPAAARAYLEARTLADRLGMAHATVLRAHLLEVEAAAAAGQLAQADDAYAAFERLVNGSPPRWTEPLIHRANGARAAARGDTTSAVTELEAAVDDGLALPPDVGRALLALAAALRRERRYRQARDAGERARAVFAELGMPPFVAAADRELARIPGRRGGGDELTPAEARIASLVAAGRSNRDVAAELVLSVKTVEVTLTRVYEKLGVRSRSELGARVRAGSTD